MSASSAQSVAEELFEALGEGTASFEVIKLIVAHALDARTAETWDKAHPWLAHTDPCAPYDHRGRVDPGACTCGLNRARGDVP